MNTLLRKDRAATVEVPYLETARIATAVASFYRPDGTAVFTALACVPDSYELTAVAAERSRKVSLNMAALGAIRRNAELHLTKAGATPDRYPSESVVAVAMDDADLLLDKPLVYGWEVDDLLTPHAISVPLSAVQTATLGRNYRVSVDVTFMGSTAVHTKTVLADVVAHVPSCLLTVAKLRQRLPSTFSELAGNLDRDDSGFDTLIDVAFGLVLADVNRIVSPDFIVSDGDFVEPTFSMVRLLMAEDGRYLPQEIERRGLIDDMHAQYTRVLDTMMKNIGWLDRNQNMAVDDGEENAKLQRRVVLNPF